MANASDLADPEPSQVYVDPGYRGVHGQVSFGDQSGSGTHFIGLDAFDTIQAAVDRVSVGGIVNVAAGTYIENVVISKPLLLLGPNAGVSGGASVRQPEAKVMPGTSDPENGPIISVETDDVVIDGFFFDGQNPALTGGYDANGVRVHAAAGIQNGSYPDLVDVAGVTIRNNIVTNISYDGICLDRYQYYGTASGWNYICNNKLANMWEGILTYSLDAVIENNVISNVTHGIGVHCVATSAPKGFRPLVAFNSLWIGQWWPVEIDVARAPGIWINFRREDAAPLDVVSNVVTTPTETPALKQTIGLYVLTVDGGGKVRFKDNVVNGEGNCTLGLAAASCWTNGAVQVVGGAFREINGTGIMVHALDPKWGPGDCLLNVSNVEVTLTPSGVGVSALQEPGTINRVGIGLVGSSSIRGGMCGVAVRGTNASASIIGRQQAICGNGVGIDVDAGRALVQGNVLTNNHTAAITAENDGMIDAGDCLGGNLTGLATGNGENGSSAGGNDLSGYGCDRIAPWAIKNTGTMPVLADLNRFNAAPYELLQDAVAGPVRFSDAGNLAVTAPPAIKVECIGDVPPGATSVRDFVLAGGAVKAGSASGVAFHDFVTTNRPGNYTVYRQYAVSGGCSQSVFCNQIISAEDNQPPSLQCSADIVQGVDKGCDYATITFTNIAADSCGELLGPWVPVTTGRFAIGTNTIIVIATDLANNSSVCTFQVAVVGPPVITKQPSSRTNLAGTSASFQVAAISPAPLSFQWNQNGTALYDGGKISGATSTELTVGAVAQADIGNYQVDVSNFAGTTSSAKAHLTVFGGAQGLLRVIECSHDYVVLEMSGAEGNRFALLSSTNLSDWVGVCTNVAPFVVAHTNIPWASCRFYRATLVAPR